MGGWFEDMIQAVVVQDNRCEQQIPGRAECSDSTWYPQGDEAFQVLNSFLAACRALPVERGRRPRRVEGFPQRRRLLRQRPVAGGLHVVLLFLRHHTGGASLALFVLISVSRVGCCCDVSSPCFVPRRCLRSRCAGASTAIALRASSCW